MELIKYEEFSKEMVELPQWLIDASPVMKPTFTLLYDEVEQSFLVKNEDGEVIDYSYYITELYDKYKSRKTYNLVLDESIDGHGGNYYEKAFFESSSRLFLSFTEEDDLNLLSWNYYCWVNETSKLFTPGSTDFVAAYNWLENHPVFWWRPNPDSFPYSWITSLGLEDIRISVSRTSDGSPLISLEHGEHCKENQYANHYHNIELDVEADSFEKAYLQLAEKLFQHFNIDGSPRE